MFPLDRVNSLLFKSTPPFPSNLSDINLSNSFNFENDEAVLEALNLINIYSESLIHSSNASAQMEQFITQQIKLEWMYSILASTEATEEQRTLVVSILSKVFQVLPLTSHTVMEMLEYASLGLMHSDLSVRKISIAQISRAVKGFPENVQMSIVQIVTKAVADDSISVAQSACKCLASFILDRCDKSISLEVLSELKAISSTSSIVYTRCHDIYIEVIKGISSSATQELQHFLLTVIQEMKADFEANDDPIMKLNIIETISLVAETPCGWNMLQTSGFVSSVIGLLASADEATNYLDSYWTVASLKFLGKIASVSHVDFFELQEFYPSVMEAVGRNAASSDQVLSRAAIDTLGMIGNSPNGFAVVSNFETDPVVARTIEASFVKLLDNDPDAHNCLMNAFASIVIGGEKVQEMLRKNENISLHGMTPQNITARLGRLWRKLPSVEHPSPISVIFKYATQPFPDVKYAALNVFSAIAKQPWAHQEISEYPGLLEFLLNRSTESEKAGLEGKYKILNRLLASIAKTENSRQFFSQALIERIQAYVQGGPFAGIPGLSVATRSE